MGRMTTSLLLETSGTGHRWSGSEAGCLPYWCYRWLSGSGRVNIFIYKYIDMYIHIYICVYV